MGTIRGTGRLAAIAVAVVGVAFAVRRLGGRPESGTPAPLEPRFEGEEPRGAERPPILATAGGANRPSGSRGVGRVEGVARLGGKPVAASIRAGRARVQRAAPGGTRFEEVASTTSGDDGTFAFAVSSFEPVCVVGETAGARGAAFAWFAWGRASGRERIAHLDLELVEARETLAGTAVDGEGRPWHGTLRAMLAGSGLPFGSLPVAPTDVEGRFRFVGLAPGAYLVGANLGPGARVFGATLLIPSTELYRLVVAIRGRPVEIRTTDAQTGEPVPDAEVTIEAMRFVGGAGREGADVVSRQCPATSTSGRASCLVPTADLVRARGTKPGFAPDESDLPSGSATCTLLLTRTGTVEGTVVRAEGGTPVPGIEVRLEQSGEERRTATDATGSFRLEDVPPTVVRSTTRPVSLSVSGLGLTVVLQGGDRDVVPVEVESGQVSRVEIRVAPTRSIVGSVRRADGTAATDAEVWLSTDKPFFHRSAFSAARARTDAAGEFRLDDIPLYPQPEDVVVLARAPGTGTASQVLEIGVGAESRAPRKPEDPIVLVLPRAGSLDLRVVDAATGHPLPGIDLSLAYQGSIEFSGVSDGSGRIHAVGLTPASLTVAGTDPSQGADFALPSFAKHFVEVPTTGVGSATVELERTCKIGGTLTYADGSPVTTESFGLHMAEVGGGHGLSTDVGATFQRIVPYGTYEVTVAHASMEDVGDVEPGDPRLLARTRIEPGVANAVIRLSCPPPTPLEIRVVDEAGARIPSGSIGVRAATRQEESDAHFYAREEVRIQDGRATIDAPRIPFWLQFRGNAGSGAVWTQTRAGPFEPGTAVAELRISRGLSIEGKVVGPGGRAVAGVAVWLSQALAVGPEDWREDPLEMWRTEPDGSFRLDALAPGTYKVWAASSPPLVGSVALDVVAGRKDLRLTLAALLDADVRVLAADGRGAADVLVSAYRAPEFDWNRPPQSMTDATGVAHLVGLDPNATYLLELSRVFAHPAGEPQRQEDWRPAPTTITLADPDVISIRIVDGSGARADGVQVLVREPGHPEQPPSIWKREAPGDPILVVRRRPGPVALVASSGATFSRTVIVAERTANAVLELPASTGRVRIEPEGASPDAVGMTRSGWIADWYVWDASDPTLHAQGVSAPDGVVSIDGLSVDRTYACLIVSRERGGFTALLEGVKADGATLRASRQPIVPFEGRVTAPDGVEARTVAIVELGMEVPLEDGRFRVRRLPAGPWTLRATGVRARAPVYAQVRVEGARVPDIALPPR